MHLHETRAEELYVSLFAAHQSLCKWFHLLSHARRIGEQIKV